MSPIEILLVEDNEADVMLTEESLSDCRIPNRLHVAVDGVEALRFLRREGPYQHANRPDLILLDLNLPRKDGRAVLAEVKQDPSLRRIPVVVLSSSEAEDDIRQTYELGANCFVTKPMEYHRFQGVMKSIEEFWFSTARLPVAA